MNTRHSAIGYCVSLLAAADAAADPQSTPEPLYQWNTIHSIDDRRIEHPIAIFPSRIDPTPQGHRIGERLRLDLPDGIAPVVAVIEHVEKPVLSDSLWRGRIEGFPHGRFLLVINDGVVAAEFSAPALGHYLIRHTTRGAHGLLRVDPTEHLTCLTSPDHTITNPSDEPVPRRRADQFMGNSATLIDVMVVYTQSARLAVGGTPAVEALIDSYFAFTNTAYEDSGVNARVRLVHAQEIPYTESGSSNLDLDRLRATNDGFMDEVHPLRDTWGADLVSLINTSGSAGVAFMMQGLSVDFASSAFSAIGADTGTIPGGLVFAHETAHNMGCSHNHFPGAPQGISCYAFGYRTPDEQWRTIMASSPGAFVNFFSNPEIEFKGQPLGVAGDGCPPDAADNVRSLNDAATTVAMFRPTVVPCGADVECDGRVDLLDFERLLQCVTGPGAPQTPGCANFDFDVDDDVDFTDFGAFQFVFTGPQP